MTITTKPRDRHAQARVVVALAAIVLAAEVMDIGTTLYGLSHLGAVEANPLLVSLGMWPFMIAKLLYAPLAVLAIVRLRPPLTWLYLVGLVVAAWLPGVWNLVTVIR